MTSIKEAMDAAFNAFIDGHKAIPSTRVTLAEFDSSMSGHLDLNFVYRAKPVGEVPALDLRPRGGTPLVDALAMVIDQTGLRLAALPTNERPKGVLFVVISDGEENTSRSYTKAAVKTRIEHQTTKYNWQFVFLGADQDAIHEAATYGIDVTKAITFQKSMIGTYAASGSMAANTMAYVSQTANAIPNATVPAFTITQRVASAGDDEDLQKKATQTP